MEYEAGKTKYRKMKRATDTNKQETYNRIVMAIQETKPGYEKNK